MRKAVAIFFALIFLLLSVKDLATYVNFKVQQQKIIRVSCINIEMPELMCYAKCVLEKQIQSNHEDTYPQDKPRPILKEYQDIQVFRNTIPSHSNVYDNHLRSTIYHSNKMKYLLLTTDIFHPPKLS